MNLNKNSFLPSGFEQNFSVSVSDQRLAREIFQNLRSLTLDLRVTKLPCCCTTDILDRLMWGPVCPV